MLKIIFLLLAFYTGEVTSDLNKICYYESAKGTHAITIKSYQVCPVSIEV